MKDRKEMDTAREPEQVNEVRQEPLDGRRPSSGEEMALIDGMLPL